MREESRYSRGRLGLVSCALFAIASVGACAESSGPPVLGSPDASASVASNDVEGASSEGQSVEDTPLGEAGTDSLVGDGNGPLGVSDAEQEPSDDASGLADTQTDGTDDAEGDAEADVEADVDWGPDPECQFPYSSTVTVKVLEDGTPVPAYPVSHPAVASISYVYDGQAMLQAIDETGEVWWTVEVGERQIFGGFDFDQDGWPDVGLVKTNDTGEMCGSEILSETSIEFVKGMTGEILTPISPLKDLCWDFEESVYPTSQWTAGGVLFGTQAGSLAISPYYATNSWFLQYAENWNLTSFIYPSTQSFDGTYPVASKPNLWDEEVAFVENSHVANGLVVESGTGSKLVFFTSGRVVQYAFGSYGEEQLVADHPFLSGNRKDLAGRNYGLVAVDPAYPQHVALLAGTDAFTLFLDRITGKQESDEWGGIERHVAIYNTGTDALDDRFYSTAHDGQDGYKYEGRVVYPANPFVLTGVENQPSRLAYNVFEKGRWNLHISKSGSTEDLTVLKGLYLWNIQDLDGNGTAEWVISPTDSGEDEVEIPAYLPDWETQLYQWDESILTLQLAGKFAGVIPYLLPSFRTPMATSTRNFLYPLLISEAECSLYLAVRSATGGLEWLSIGQ